MLVLRFDQLHRPDGWLAPAWVTVDDDGFVKAVDAAPPPMDAATRFQSFAGAALPGMPNVHGHAFQRVFAGATECAHGARGAAAEDSFWTWREAMYRVAAALEPGDVEAIAALVQMELLEAGFTAIGEFHYLHHTHDGTPYAARAEMAQRILAAAERTGIAVTLLPVAYFHAGFGRPLAPMQRRFGSTDPDEFLALFAATRDAVRRGPSRHRIGVAPHSLRAVSPEELTRIVAAVHAQEPAAPVHVHVAEQRAEVEQCVQALGVSPVTWFTHSAGLDHRWCLVHATHARPDELLAVARSGAVVGLCPTTEANLGDGLFPLPGHLAEGGRIAIGSDSHVSIDLAEELRVLEYGQRLRDERRNRAGEAGHAQRRHVGRRLYDACLAGGSRALDQPLGAIEVGRRCDVVVLDTAHARLLGLRGDTLLDAFVFSNSGRSAIRDVLVGGLRVVADGRHVAREAIVAEYAKVVARLAEVAP
ncbi:MAG: formimidoylglutamate deiminase [Planctomycetes bacterium]|nr:formimidoylglutamate deiminase [Planctomycetota bacterium]